MKGHVMTRLPLNTLTIFWNCIEPGLRVIQTITGLTCL
jgi:hypothetical protein